ncbi:MAG: hypothetical protein RL040_297 [Bacteroidota bacterium]|jgi:hypothetical protein
MVKVLEPDPGGFLLCHLQCQNAILAKKSSMPFSTQDELMLKQRGLSVNSVLKQIHQFVHDTHPARLDRPCIVGDGILALSPTECITHSRYFEESKPHISIQKFVPSSGAASRMFKHLYNYNAENISDLTEEFILRFDQFPFKGVIETQMKFAGLDLDALRSENNWESIFDFILGSHGLNYDDQLKGLVIFHRYAEELSTAFDEHLIESAAYAKQGDGRCRVHFTLAPHHVERVKDYLDRRVSRFEYDHFELSFSTQDPSTDTLALTQNNEPFRDRNASLVFRPSGHGALIHNLQRLSADVIFIKNIDNVTVRSNLADTVFYKQILGGLLLKLRANVFDLLNRLDTDDQALDEALDFIQAWFQPGLSMGMSREQLVQYAKLRLDRPLRVCGMVRNEGEPGGGPFWVRMQGGYISKQIVERSQVDMNDPAQMKILSSSTHFNPVDLVCSIRNRQGENYHLDEFIDYTAGFVTEKFQQGSVLKALEWPGLWNGAMALWNTVFVEVPVSTFNPVKTVNDLLRPGHQS